MEEVDPVDLTPLMSCSAPIVTAPASDNGEEIEDGDDGRIEGLLKVMCDALGNIEELDRGLRDLTSPLLGGTSVQKPPADPDANVWDSGRTWEKEYQLYPNTNLTNASVVIQSIFHKNFLS